MTDKKSVAAKIDPEIMRKFKAVCAEKGITMSEQFEKIMEVHINIKRGDKNDKQKTNDDQG